MAKPNPWTAAKTRTVHIREGARGQAYPTTAADPVKPELKFFVLMLEQLGCYVMRAHTSNSPLKLFILFTASYEMALRLAAVDEFTLSIAGYTGHRDTPYRPGHWVLSWNIAPIDIKTRDLGFRYAARQMVRIFGPLKPATKPKTRTTTKESSRDE
jgi:hypothetical protein